MKIGSLFFLLGTVLAVYTPSYPSWSIICLVPVFITLLAFYFRTGVLFFFLIGWGLALLRIDIVLEQYIDPSLEKKPLYVEGSMVGMPLRAALGSRFIFKVDRILDIDGIEIDCCNHVLLHSYNSSHHLAPGEKWRLPVKLKRPHGTWNPGGFDYEKWLFAKGIRATGYIDNKRHAEQIVSLHGFDFSLHDFITRTRIVIHDMITEQFAASPSRSLLLGLAIGDRRDMTEDIWRPLRIFGLVHLFAISGLHIGFAFLFGYSIVRWGWVCLPRLTMYIPAQRAGCIAGFIVALVYAMLAGFSVVSQRALIMLAVLWWAKDSGKNLSPYTALAIALLAVLCWDSFAVLAPGFWLSFITVVYCVYCYRAWKQTVLSTKDSWQMRITYFMKLQLFLTIALLPWLLFFFQYQPLWSIPANLLAIPWISFVATPFTLLGLFFSAIIPVVGAWFLSMAHLSLYVFWQPLTYLATLPALTWYKAIDLTTMLFAVIGLSIFLGWRYLSNAWIGLLWLFPLFFTYSPMLEEGVFSASILDVGQGLAVTIATRNHVLLYDTGFGIEHGWNHSERTIFPFLRQRGIDAIDTMVLSHHDVDHIGGARALHALLPIKQVFASFGMQGEKTTHLCHKGVEWYWDGVRFEFLHPDSYTEQLSDNNSSCVLMISGAFGRLLLTGDIERKIETRLVEKFSHALNATVLVAAHHGSNSSSSDRFIATVSPQHVVFSAGYLNRYAFPHPKTLKRFQKHGVKIFSTATHGGVELIFKKMLQCKAFRFMKRRVWHAQVDNIPSWCM